MIAVIFDFLYNDFESIPTTMLKCGNKTINEILLISIFAEAKFINKQVICMIGYLTMMFKHQTKGKVISKDRYFNCGKLGYFKKDYIILNIHKKNKLNKSFNNSRQ